MNTIKSLFKIRYGDRTYTDKGVLDDGLTPLIASQGIENGVYGFFNIPTKYNSPIITVPRTGSIGYTFVQLLPCTVTDDCIILIPKKPMSVEYLYYVAAIVRFSRWRFNYARKITPTRLGIIKILSDEEFTPTIFYREMYKQLYPKASQKIISPMSPVSFLNFNITDLFILERGHFHALDQLEKGNCPTVSRISVNNGVTGFYNKPAKAKTLPKTTLTVSTVTGDAFIQHSSFIATDNVVICRPKIPMIVTTLIYIQALLNKVKWRYSYGRQCYKGNFQKTVLNLPINKDNTINENYIEQLVTALPYWDEYKARLLD
ncbi:restriction endonuclease subunit S [Candidatus Bathyarchaeota archaeon]|nr:restriction endonuclease subunit S [Candidatus Bathyarchaeota archaeon]